MKKLTEIKAGLKCCNSKANACPRCPYVRENNCNDLLRADALASLQIFEGALRAALGGLRRQDAEVIIAYSQNDMNAKKTGDALYVDRTGIHYHLNKVHRVMGKNPRYAEDLAALLPMMRMIAEMDEGT